MQTVSEFVKMPQPSWRHPMPYLELTVRCQRSELTRYERALEDLGALSVTLQDAHLDLPDEQAIFEPGVGETPLWQELSLTALFDAQTEPLALLAALESFDGDLDWSVAHFKHIADADWERAWMDQYVPLRFGANTWIVPWNRELPEDAQAPQAAVVRLDPGLAFGSGTHPTTALCLRWLDGLAEQGVLRDTTVLDFGCGSGILALAALRLGATHAVGIDNDPQALTATADNAERNGLSERLRVFAPGQAAGQHQYPIVVANILASALESLAPQLAQATQPGGRIALSGILDGQQHALLERYAPWFEQLAVAQDGDWVRIDGVRKYEH